MAARAGAQTPAAPARAERCGVGVRAVLAADAAPAAQSQTYLALLQSGGAERRVSGTLWVNASGAAYHVPFRDRRAGASIDASEGIAFRLPPRASLEDVFVDELEDGTPRVCAIDGVWTPALPVRAAGRQLRDAATTDAQPIAAADASCRAPDVPGFVVASISPRVPPEADAAGIGGPVTVLVKLAADSTILTVAVARSPSEVLNAAALEVARHTIFSTAVRRCRPVPGTFTFVVQFEVARRATPRP